MTEKKKLREFKEILLGGNNCVGEGFVGVLLDNKMCELQLDYGYLMYMCNTSVMDKLI